MNEEEKLKDLKAVYSGAVQSGEIGIANMIKGGIDLVEKQQKEIEKLKESANYNWEQYQDIGKMYFDLKEKIENKIEELEDLIEKENSRNDGYYTDETIYFDGQKTILQELLEERN